MFHSIIHISLHITESQLDRQILFRQLNFIIMKRSVLK